MVIQNNISALNSHRNLLINNNNLSQNLERLSSGFRINRASDDAAGLAISERMRGQIRGLAMAEQNTSHAINLIQTAEGGLSETHAIVQRMRELAVQSSNGTFQDSDRMQINHEFQALMSEIDRIAESTHYNGINLLDGSLGSTAGLPNVAGAQASGQAVAFENFAGEARAQAAFGGIAETGVATAGNTVELTYRDANDQVNTVSFTLSGANAGEVATNLQAQMNDHFAQHGVTVSGTAAPDADNLTIGGFTANDPAASSFRFVEARVADAAGEAVATQAAGAVTAAGSNAGRDLDLDGVRTINIDGRSFQFVTDASQVAAGSSAIFVNAANLDADGALTGVTADVLSGIVGQLSNLGFNVEAAVNAGGDDVLRFTAGTTGELTFQIGANGGADQRVSMSVGRMSSDSLGISGGDFTRLEGASLASASILTAESAQDAIGILDGALDMVSAQRAQLGAMQNRLESTMNSLGIARENLTAAESTIRDVDMAAEMMQFTQNNILTQAAQSMLAQANQLPQGVLQLLR